MMHWSEEKNTILKQTRQISFERIELAIANNLLRVTHGEDPNYPHQYRFYIEIDSYIWVVPAVRTWDDYFLKTAYPSRRAQKKYNS
jgi:hypothetical protein